MIKLEIEKTRNGVVIRQIDWNRGQTNSEQAAVYELLDQDGKINQQRIIDFIGTVLLRLDISEIGISITKANNEPGH